MNQPYAIIDLGSNTFYLLIATYTTDQGITPLYRERVFTSISKGGLQFILPEQFKIGIDAIKKFKTILIDFGCKHVRVLGTAMLRSASNANDFIQIAEKILGINIEIISGQEEAEYIFNGMMLSTPLQSDTHLLIDIGGGSVEFIISQNGIKTFSASYSIGLNVLYHMFSHSIPITSIELNIIKKYIYHTTLQLIDEIALQKPKYISGASGIFEILCTLIGYDFEYGDLQKIKTNEFIAIRDHIFSLDKQGLERLKGLPPERIQLITVSLALIDTFVEIINPQAILVSPYSLKEGVLLKMSQEIRSL